MPNTCIEMSTMLSFPSNFARFSRLKPLWFPEVCIPLYLYFFQMKVYINLFSVRSPSLEASGQQSVKFGFLVCRSLIHPLFSYRVFDPSFSQLWICPFSKQRCFCVFPTLACVHSSVAKGVARISVNILHLGGPLGAPSWDKPRSAFRLSVAPFFISFDDTFRCCLS